MDADDRCPPERFKVLLDAYMVAREKGWDGVCSASCAFGTVSEGMDRYVAWQNGLLDPKDHLENRFVEIPALHQTGIYPRELLVGRLGGYRDLPDWPIDLDTWMRMGELG